MANKRFEAPVKPLRALPGCSSASLASEKVVFMRRSRAYASNGSVAQQVHAHDVQRRARDGGR